MNLVPINRSTINSIYPCSINLKSCPICYTPLKFPYIYTVPVLKNYGKKIETHACLRCNLLFTNCETIRKIIEFGIKSDIYSINFDYDFDYDDNFYINLYTKLKSPLCLVNLISKSRDELLTYIITADKCDLSKDSCILPYDDTLSLKILTAFILKDNEISHSGKTYFINFDQEDILINDNGYIRFIGPKTDFTFNEPIYLSSNGGYYEKNSNLILVDGLVFCGESPHLEVLTISYDKYEDRYFIDPQKWQSFCKNHGYPILNYLSTDKRYFMSIDFNKWAEESLLHIFGYNANQSKSLTDFQRQSILSAYIDLGYGKISQVLNFLNQLINVNGKNKPIARRKWERDYEFLSKYKRNPQKAVFFDRVMKLDF